MDEKVMRLLDSVRSTARLADAVAADMAAQPDPSPKHPQKSPQSAEMAKLNVRLFDQNRALDAVLRELGQVLYCAHLGQAGEEEAVCALLTRADELKRQVDETKEHLAALRHSKPCPLCGALCAPEDHYCRHCGCGL